MEPSDLTRKIKINIKSNFNDILTNNRDKSIGGMNSFSRIQQKDSLINSASSKDESIKGPSLYSDEEDDCPNFVYSVDAMEVAKEVDPANLQKNGSKESADVQPQEEHEETERDEDLVQLDDDEEDLRTSTESILEEQNKSDNKTLDLNLYNDSSDFDDDLQEDADLGRTPLCNKSGKSLQNADIEVEAEDSQVIDEARSGKKSKEMRHPNEGQDEDEDDIDNLNLTESISDDENINLERSYTPCLDEHFQLEKDKQEELNDSEEKQDDESKSSKKAAELDGIETEMISEEDDEDFSKNKTNDLSLARKKEHDLSKDFVLEKDDTKSRSEFKKVSKSTKGRNYRDKINPFSPRSTPAPHNNKENRNRRRSRSRSRSSHTKERSGRRRQSRSSSRHRSKRTQRSSPVRRRKDLERYDVRNVVDKNKQSSRSTNNLNNNNNKDEYGRDLVSARRRSRSQTPTRPPVIRKSVSSSLSLSSRSSSSSESSYYKRKRRSGGIMRRRTRSRSYNNFSHEVDNHNAGFADDRRSRRESNHVPRKRSISVESKGTKRPKTSDSHSKSYRYSSPSPRKNVNKRPTNPDDTKRGRKRTKSYTKRDNTPINVVSSPYAVANDHENHSSDDRWTPPLANDDKRHKESTKKNVKEKKKKSKNRKRDRSEQSKPSKEVFASGDNILVSISFNNKSPTQTTSSSTHHHHHEPAALDIQQQTIVTIPKELNSTSLNANLSKSKSDTRNKSDSKSGGRRTESRKSDSKRLRGKDSLNAAAKKHKKLELDKVKPVAIIDLDRSPFKELTPSPKAVIVLSDSENEEEVQEQPIIEATQLKDNCQNVDITNETCQPDRNSECESSLGKQVDEILGPKTPPEPSSSSSSSNSLIKFSLSKSKVKLGKNALGNEEEAEVDADVGDNTTDNPAPVENSDANKLLNTPPGSPDDDVYNPFEPTKSPSPDPANGSNMQLQQINSSSEKLNNDAIISTNTNSKPDENHSSPSTLNQMDMMLAFITSSSSQLMKNINNTDSTDLSNNKKDINMEDKINVIKPSISNQSGCSKDIPKDKSKLPTQQQSNDVTDKAGVNNKPKSTLELFDSPYSPGSSDYEDLFEPPGNMSPPSSQNTVTPQKKSNSKIDLIDDLFGGSSPPSSSKKTPNSLNKRQSGATSAMAIAKSRRNLGLFSALPFPPTSKSPHKTRTSKGSRNQNSNKLNENQIRILDDIPSSAVEMQVKDKFLIKLNRQERVVEEVKLVLKPHYNKKHIDKEDYKEILRRSVPKICHSRSGEINPKKIQDLIEAYVHKFRHQKKRHKQ